MNKCEIEDLINSKIEFAGKKFGKEIKMLLIETLGLEKMRQQEIEQTRYIPVAKWDQYHPYPSVGGMQMRVFYESKNGFKEFGVVHRDGKRVLINENAYFRWQKNRNAKELA